jgi:hypothetical protein
MRVESRASTPPPAARRLQLRLGMSAPRSLIAFSIGFFFSIVLVLATACSAAAPEQPAQDAAPARPLEPAGTYELVSTYSLAAPPDAAASVLDELLAATDGPDDPSRYLIDLMIAKLPEGRARTYATALAPYVAAYVNDRLAEVAPRFSAGVRALSVGLSRIAHRFGTLDELAIDASSDTAGTMAEATSGASRRAAWRTVTGLRFDLVQEPDASSGAEAPSTSVDVHFAPLGMPDTAAATQVVHVGRSLLIDRHAIALPYTALLRLGFDFAVVPSVVAGTHDLARALGVLVDCDQLGALVADWVGIGSPSFYAGGCTLGLTALAARVYARIDAIDATSVALELAGTVHAADANEDAQLDTLSAGTWTGAFAGSLVTGHFAGERR